MKPRNAILAVVMGLLFGQQLLAQQQTTDSPLRSLLGGDDWLRPVVLHEHKDEQAEGANGDKKKDNGKEENEEPKHIRDNGFFVEEAVNQEPGVAQHIFNWINFWDQTAQERTRTFAATY